MRKRKERTKVMSLRVNESLYHEIKAMCIKDKIALNRYLRKTIEANMKKRSSKKEN